jgi:hypothetical protein
LNKKRVTGFVDGANPTGLVSQKFRSLDSNNQHQGDGVWRKDTEQNFEGKRFGWHSSKLLLIWVLDFQR